MTEPLEAPKEEQIADCRPPYIDLEGAPIKLVDFFFEDITLRQYGCVECTIRVNAFNGKKCYSEQLNGAKFNEMRAFYGELFDRKVMRWIARKVNGLPEPIDGMEHTTEESTHAALTAVPPTEGETLGECKKFLFSVVTNEKEPTNARITAAKVLASIIYAGRNFDFMQHSCRHEGMKGIASALHDIDCTLERKYA